MQNQRIEYDEHISNTPTVELLVALLCLSKTYDGGMCWSTALAARWFISLILHGDLKCTHTHEEALLDLLNTNIRLEKLD